MSTERARVAGLVLAAGHSTRMGGRNKLLLDLHGKPMLTRVVDAVLESVAWPVVVVTGYQAGSIRRLLSDRDVRFVHNPDHVEGVGSSIRAGVGALPSDLDGVVICLGDLPALRRSHIDALVSSFEPEMGCCIGVPTHAGRRGHPVLLASCFFPELSQLTGDRGARHLIELHVEKTYEIPVSDAAVLLDVDTLDQLQRARGRGRPDPFQVSASWIMR